MNGKLAENSRTFANKRKGIHQQRKEIQQQKRSHGCQGFEATKTGLEWPGIKQCSYDLKSPKWRFDHQYGDTDPANKGILTKLKNGTSSTSGCIGKSQIPWDDHPIFFFFLVHRMCPPHIHTIHGYSWCLMLCLNLFIWSKYVKIMAYHVYHILRSYFPLCPQRSRRSPSGYPKDRWTHPLSQPTSAHQRPLGPQNGMVRHPPPASAISA